MNDSESESVGSTKSTEFQLELSETSHGDQISADGLTEVSSSEQLSTKVNEGGESEIYTATLESKQISLNETSDQSSFKTVFVRKTASFDNYDRYKTTQTIFNDFQSLQSFTRSVENLDVLLASQPNSETSIDVPFFNKTGLNHQFLLGIRKFIKVARNGAKKLCLDETRSQFSSINTEPIRIYDRCNSSGVDLARTYESLSIGNNSCTTKRTLNYFSDFYFSRSNTIATLSSYCLENLFEEKISISSESNLLLSSETEGNLMIELTLSSSDEYDRFLPKDGVTNNKENFMTPEISEKRLDDSSIYSSFSEECSLNMEEYTSDSSLSIFVKHMLEFDINSYKKCSSFKNSCQIQKSSLESEQSLQQAPVNLSKSSLNFPCSKKKFFLYSGKEALDKIPEYLSESTQNIFLKKTHSSRIKTASDHLLKKPFNENDGNRHDQENKSNFSRSSEKQRLLSHANLRTLKQRQNTRVKARPYQLNSTKTSKNRILFEFEKQAKKLNLEPRYLLACETTSYIKVVQFFVENGYFKRNPETKKCKNNIKFEKNAILLKSYLSSDRGSIQAVIDCLKIMFTLQN